MDSSGLFKFIKDVTPHDVEHFFTLTILNAEFEDVQNAQDGQAYVGSMYGIVWCHWNPASNQATRSHGIPVGPLS